MDQLVQSQGVHSCDQRSTPVTSLALDQRVTSISHSQDQGVLQLGQRIQQLDQRVQRLGQGVQSWLQSPQLRLTSTREQAVPAADQGVIEPGAQQSGQRHTQLSKTVLPFPLNSRRMKAVYLRRGLCRQLGIVSYDPAVQVWRGGKQAKLKQEKEETISTVQVRLLQSVQILPQQSLQVDIQLLPEGKVPTSTEQLVLVEPTPTLKTEMGIVMEDSLLNPPASGLAQVVLMNSTGFTQLIEAGTELGTGEAATIVEPAAENDDITSLCNINKLSSGATDRKRRDLLLEYVGQPDLPESERTKLIELIQNHHELFALEEGERGQTDLVEMEIDTGDSHPIKQPARRMPFAVRREVARQVQKMQESGIVVPSNSPWSSPVVMVRKKDGTH